MIGGYAQAGQFCYIGSLNPGNYHLVMCLSNLYKDLTSHLNNMLKPSTLNKVGGV